MDRAIAEFDGVDLLVNNAGIQHVAPVDEFPVDKWADILAINLSACFHTVRLALPAMKRNGFGRITAFLCTPAAASITGAILPVDGGWTAH